MMNLTDQRAARHYDYADSFELRLEGPDRYSPEEWMRAGVDAAPQAVAGGLRHVPNPEARKRAS